MKQYQSLLESTFQDLFNPVKDVDAIRPYFDKDYTQWVDGKMLDYDGFFRHVTALKEVIASVRELTQLLVGDEADQDIGSRLA